MTEQELWFLLARIYIVQRLNYITSSIAPVFVDVVDVLDKQQRLPHSVQNTTDSDILEAFKPVRGGELAQPKTSKKAKGA